MNWRSAHGLGRFEPVGAGLLTGLVAYAIGYLATLGVTTATQTGTVVTRNLVRASGWLYYNSQFSAVTTSATGEMSVFGGETANLLTDGRLFRPVYLGPPNVVYHAVPVVTLTLAGFVLARRLRLDSVVDTIAASGTFALGTTVAAVSGSWLFAVSAGHVTVSPQLLNGVLMTGLFFPLLFGSVGGFAGTRLWRQTND